MDLLGKVALLTQVQYHLFKLFSFVCKKSLEEMSTSELDANLQHSYEHAFARQSQPMIEVFAEIERKQL